VDYLDGFASASTFGNGYLQADGYAGYEKEDADLIGCMAHAR
jgi:hypothetical protein